MREALQKKVDIVMAEALDRFGCLTATLRRKLNSYQETLADQHRSRGSHVPSSTQTAT